MGARATPAAPGSNRLVEQGQRTLVVARTHARLAQGRANLQTQCFVADPPARGHCALEVVDCRAHLAERVVDVTQPVFRPRDGALVAICDGKRDRAFQDRQLIDRRIENTDPTQMLGDGTPAPLPVRRLSQHIERGQCSPILCLRTIERRCGDRLVARQLGIAGCVDCLTAGGVVIRKDFVSFHFRTRRTSFPQCLGHPQVHRSALMQTKRGVDHFARDAMLEAQESLSFGWKD